MQLQKIKSALTDYEKWLASDVEATRSNLFKWESQKIWQEHWDLEEINVVEMFNKALENTTTRRIWSRAYYTPKKVMLAFAAMQPHFVRAIFQDLFDESKAIGNRIDRFCIHCDELLKEYKFNHPTSTENNHFQDYEMISHYLAFQFPQQYAPYDFNRFKDTLIKIGAKDIPENHDLPRYFKVAQTLFQFIKKEERLMSLHQARLAQNHYQGASLLLVEDFCAFLYQH